MNKLKSLNAKLVLTRVERITKVYDSQNRVVQEDFEYYFPPELVEQEIGFKLKRKKK